jgi:hypothetical protein
MPPSLETFWPKTVPLCLDRGLPAGRPPSGMSELSRNVEIRTLPAVTQIQALSVLTIWASLTTRRWSTTLCRRIAIQTALSTAVCGGRSAAGLKGGCYRLQAASRRQLDVGDRHLPRGSATGPQVQWLVSAGFSTTCGPPCGQEWLWEAQTAGDRCRKPVEILFRTVTRSGFRSHLADLVQRHPTSNS